MITQFGYLSFPILLFKFGASYKYFDICEIIELNLLIVFAFYSMHFIHMLNNPSPQSLLYHQKLGEDPTHHLFKQKKVVMPNGNKNQLIYCYPNEQNGNLTI